MEGECPGAEMYGIAVGVWITVGGGGGVQGRIQDVFPGGVRVTVPQRRRRRLSGRYGGGFGGPPPRKF